MNLVGRVVQVHDLFGEAGVPHAFGGALALAYYGQPRATADIDLNVFVDVEVADTVVDLLGRIGLFPEEPRRRWVPVSGIRFVDGEGGARLDVFLSVDVGYAAILERVRTHPFGPEHRGLPFLSADDLVMFKLSFGRSRDWVDIEDVLRNGTRLDLRRIEETLVALRGPTMYPRVARLRAMAADVANPDGR